MRLLILLVFAICAGLLASEPLPDDGRHAVQAQLDMLYAHVPYLSAQIRRNTDVLNSLCIEIALAQGAHPCDATTYCEVSHD